MQCPVPTCLLTVPATFLIMGDREKHLKCKILIPQSLEIAQSSTESPLHRLGGRSLEQWGKWARTIALHKQVWGLAQLSLTLPSSLVVFFFLNNSHVLKGRDTSK